MKRGSFENAVSKKMSGVKMTPRGEVWEGVNASLNEQLTANHYNSQIRYKWIAAAVFITIFSFSLWYASSFATDENTAGANYNALLSDDFHSNFYKSETHVAQSGNNLFSWAKIVIPEKAHTSSVLQLIEEESDDGGISHSEVMYVASRYPSVAVAHLEETREHYYVPQVGYYVPQVRGNKKIRKSFNKPTFWAGLEAEAGVFNPDYFGSNPILGNINMGTVLGENQFLNPTAFITQSSMDQGVTTSLGFDFGVKLGKRWTLESGVQYTRVGNNSLVEINIYDNVVDEGGDGGLVRETAGDPEPAAGNNPSQVEEIFVQSVELENNFRFTSIPLKVGYYFVDQRFSLRLNAGVSANLLVGNSSADPSGQIFDISQSSLYNEWSFDGITGLEFGYSILDQLDFTIEPNYRRYIVPLSSSFNSSSRIVLQTGIRYTIR